MKLTVGILTHNSEKFAARSLETLVAQTGLGVLGKDWQIICLDNASKNRIELARLEKHFPQITFQREEKNLGFGKAHNLIMRKFPADFHAVLNIDVLFSPDFLAKLLEALEKAPEKPTSALRSAGLSTRAYGSAVGKLFRWDIGSTTEKTSIIDSVGIGVMRDHAFFDIGQGKRDGEKYAETKERFGGSAAAILYRRSALGELSAEGEYFDESMFMYKEDIDLAYRLLVTGHPCLYVPEAVAWHARGVGGAKSRRKRSRQERVWSTVHEALLLKKYEQWWPKPIQRATAVRQFLRSLYLLLLEPGVFFAARKLQRALEPEAEKRRNTVKHTVSFESVAHLFQ